MCLSRNFLVICLIVYAIFQFYQVYSTFNNVFVDYKNHYINNDKIKVLSVFNIIGLTTSSILLLVGALKSKPNFLIAALAYPFYKVGFFFYYLEEFYALTLGCEQSAEVTCDPNRLIVFYQHVLIFGEYFHVINN